MLQAEPFIAQNSQWIKFSQSVVRLSANICSVPLIALSHAVERNSRNETEDRIRSRHQKAFKSFYPSEILPAADNIPHQNQRKKTSIFR